MDVSPPDRLFELDNSGTKEVQTHFRDRYQTTHFRTALDDIRIGPPISALACFSLWTCRARKVGPGGEGRSLAILRNSRGQTGPDNGVSSDHMIYQVVYIFF